MAHAFRDQPRSGRPPSKWHPDVVDKFEDLLLSNQYPSAPGLHRALKSFGESRDLDVPGIEMVRRWINATDLAELSAARHGRRAARADAIPHPTVPKEFPHDVWTLDELEAPVWIKAKHPVTRELESVRPYVVLIADNFSGPILAHHVCEPFKGGALTVTFDTEDVLGAFFAAVLPDLASPACRPYVGFLPRDLRLDNAAQHNELKARLREHHAGGSYLEAQAPWRRGSIERLIGTLQDLCAGIRGHMDVCRPADRLKESEEKRRSDAAGAVRRERRRHVVAVEDLLTPDEFREALEHAVAGYQVRQHRMLGVSPEVSYHTYLRKRELRPAADALLMIPPVTLTVGKGGIEHRNRYFATEAGGVQLQVGQQVICRPDPLRRGLFAEMNGNVYFLPTMEEWSRARSGADVIRIQKAIAKEASEAGDRALRRVLRRTFGKEAPAEQAELDLALESTSLPAKPAQAAGKQNVSASGPKPKKQRQRKAAKPAAKKNEAPKAAKPVANDPAAPTATTGNGTPAPVDRRRPLPRGVVTTRKVHLRVVSNQ